MDERLDIMPCEVIVIAARPGNGKTALAMDIAEYTLDSGGTVWIFSLEMSAQQMLARCLSKRSGVDRKRILRGECSDDEMYRLTDCMRDMMKWRWQIEDTPSISPRTLIARSRILRTTHGAPHLIVIDYLQLMEADEDASGDGNRERVVAAASRACKLLSKEMNCPILLLSQLNRGSEKRADRRPTLGDLRESGAIEQDADTVLFINRPETYTKDDPSLRGVAEIIIAKYRSGEPTDFRLHFDGPRTQFSDPNDNDKL
jgi:replicative DNA helicase